MCIFSRPVISVDATQIFARPTANNTQFLVYQMQYESADENAMILPIPIAQPSNEGRLRFIGLQGYERFFVDLDAGFPYEQPVSFGCGMSRTSKDAKLQVFEVGNYIASFVPALDDFGRLDEQFKLPAETWAKIPRYKNFGFAVFQLASGALKPHPMAFEFDTAFDGIFFPTLHIHDGEIHRLEKFDHALYMQHAGLDSRVYGYVNSDVADKSTGLVRSKYAAREFMDLDAAKGIVDGNLLVHRSRIIGEQKNSDTEIVTAGHPEVLGFNFRPWLAYSPLLLVAGVFTWFFARRSKIKRAKLAQQQTTKENE